MVDSLMGEAIQVLLDSLASKEIINFLRIHEVNNGLLEKFKTRLQPLTLVLNDVEEKQGKSQSCLLQKSRLWRVEKVCFWRTLGA